MIFYKNDFIKFVILPNSYLDIHYFINILMSRSDNNQKIGIIIPTLNEEKTIGNVIKNLKTELKDFDYELVVIDGKSSDGTVSISKELGANVIIQKNKGYGEALFAGYFYASNELNCNLLVTIDADGTYSAKDCTKIINKLISFDADYVVGKRSINSENMTRSHIIGNKIISWLIRKFLKIKLQDTQSGLFGFRSYLIENIDLRQQGWAVNTELLTKALELGMKIDEINVEYYPRISKTNLNTMNAGLVNLQVILRMIRDSNPLLFLGVGGLLLLITGIYFGSIVLIDYMITGVVSHPNLAILSALFVIAGIQLISLGLVADLLKRRQQIRLKFSHNLYKKI